MKMKRFISALLVLVMVLSMAAPAFAEGDENPVQLTINQFYNDGKDHGKAWLDQEGQMNIPAVPAGKTVKIGMQPEDGYHLYSLKINGVEHKNDATKEGKVYSYDLIMPGEAVSVEVTFERHDLRLMPGDHGTLAANVDVHGVPADTVVVVTITPDTFYQLATLRMDGVDVKDQVNGNTFTFNMPDTEHDVEIVATFDLPVIPPMDDYDLELQFKQMYNDGQNHGTGWLVREGTTSLEAPAGRSIPVSVTPDPGYHLKSITVNGTAITLTKENGVYTGEFTMPAQATIVEVTFERHDLRLTVEGGNGTLTADVPVMGVPAGTEITLTATPADGYKLDTLKVNGEFVTVTGNTYVFNMPDVDHDVEVIATFISEANIEYEIVYVGNGEGGTIFGPDTARAGETVQVRFTPAEGNCIYDVGVIGRTSHEKPEFVLEGLRLTFTMPAEDTEVAVKFTKGYRVILDGVNADLGEFGGAPSQSPIDHEGDVWFFLAYANQSVDMVIRPDTGNSVSIAIETVANGTPVAFTNNDGNVSFTMPAEDVIVHAVFSEGQLPQFHGHALLLTGQIGLQFFMDLPGGAEAWQGSYMTFEGNKMDSNVHYGEPKLITYSETDKRWAYTIELSSIQMADKFTPTFHYFVDGSEVEFTITDVAYSAEDYIIWGIDPANTSGEMLAIIRSLADYGYYSQPYLSAQNGWTVGVDYAQFTTRYTESFNYSEVQTALTPYAVETDITGFTYRVNFSSFTSLDIAFKLAEGEEVLLDGVAPETTTGNGFTIVTIDRITAKQLTKTHILKVGEKTVDNISAMTYAYKMLSKSDSTSECKNLMCAFYNYGAACGAFSGN